LSNNFSTFSGDGGLDCVQIILWGKTQFLGRQRYQHSNTAPDDFSGLVTEYFLCRRIERLDHTLLIYGDNPIRGCVNNGPYPGLAIAQSFFRLLEFIKHTCIFNSEGGMGCEGHSQTGMLVGVEFRLMLVQRDHPNQPVAEEQGDA